MHSVGTWIAEGVIRLGFRNRTDRRVLGVCGGFARRRLLPLDSIASGAIFLSSLVAPVSAAAAASSDTEPF